MHTRLKEMLSQAQQMRTRLKELRSQAQQMRSYLTDSRLTERNSNVRQ